ncbi:MAG: hypothetical protein H8E66_22970, partial [Planctomycetes bacterium]|nr:hypothetical protein [Planctomycetota bacterium]
MSKRRRHISNPGTSATDVPATSSERLRPLWLGAVTALFVATPLIPSEAAPSGLGVSLLMAWFTLCAAFMVMGALQRNLRLRIGATEIGVFVFVALHSLSAILLAEAGQPRQTLNMLWQWAGFGVAFFLVRQVVRTAQESRALIAVMIALAVCLLVHGDDPYFRCMRQARRAHEDGKQGTLPDAGTAGLGGSRPGGRILDAAS